MTFLQRQLGTNYKWWYILKFAFKSNTAYRGNSIMWLLSSLVQVSGVLFVWFINKNESINFSTIFTYLIMGEAFLLSSAVTYDIGENIQDGKIITKLLRPTNVFGFYFAQAFGYQFFENCSKCIIYLSIAFIFSQYLITPSFVNFILFLTFGILSYLISSFYYYIVGFTAFWFTAFFGSANFFNNTKILFSGQFFPLNAIPNLKALLFFPFAFTFYYPMQIFLGKYDSIQIAQIFAGGIFWCLILWILARLVFRLGLKKNEAVGL